MRISSCFSLAAASSGFFQIPSQPAWVAAPAVSDTLSGGLPRGSEPKFLAVPVYQTDNLVRSGEDLAQSGSALLPACGAVAALAVLGYSLGRKGSTTLHRAPVDTAARRSAAARMVDMDVIAGVAVALGGVGGGIGLIIATENAGKRNEQKENQQPCVVCKTKQVVDCTICQGTGRDQYASLVAGVQEQVAEVGGEGSVGTVVVDDWDSGPKAVVMYKDILDRYPVKVTGEGQCLACDGRGVIVCDNCQGTGLQPRFLERYSPDDFMD